MKKNLNITKPHDSEDVASPFALHNIEVALYNDGSFENEALENEDRSTKHPKLENEAP